MELSHSWEADEFEGICREVGSLLRNVCKACQSGLQNSNAPVARDPFGGHMMLVRKIPSERRQICSRLTQYDATVHVE
jgi:hypothetical protein